MNDHLASISYKASIYSLGGILIGLLLFIFIQRADIFLKRTLGTIMIFMIICSFVFTICSLGVLSLLRFGLGGIGGGGIDCEPDEIITEMIITEYYATIKPVEFSKGSFSASEEVTYEVINYPCEKPHEITRSAYQKTMPERTTYSSSRGLFVREILLVPLDNTAVEYASCSSAGNIELADFPKRSFYEARRAEGITTSSYLDTESIQWKQNVCGNDIVFAYVASPYHVFRDLLSPLIGISYQSDWILGLASVIISSILISIIKPALEDYIKNKSKSLVEKNQDKTNEPAQSSLIISSKGEEKTIKVKKPK